MPYRLEWFEPEVYYTLPDGTRIFYTYNDNDNGEQNEFNYTTSIDDNGFNFDIRDVAAKLRSAGHPTKGVSRAKIMNMAYTLGVIKAPDEARDSTFTFDVQLRGRGTNPQDAWLDAVEALSLEPGPPPESYEREYDE